MEGKFYIKHKAEPMYMYCKESQNWPCGSLNAMKKHKFSICDLQGKELENCELENGMLCKLGAGSNTTMYENYEFAYPDSTSNGWIWFDVKDSDEAKQMWKLTLQETCKGKEVTFENKHWSGWYLGSHEEWLCTEEGTPVWWSLETC